jgi:hypothetical protein
MVRLQNFSDVQGKPYRTSLRLNSTAQISKDALILTIVVTRFRQNWIEILSRILAARAAAERAVCDEGLMAKSRVCDEGRYARMRGTNSLRRAWPGTGDNFRPECVGVFRGFDHGVGHLAYIPIKKQRDSGRHACTGLREACNKGYRFSVTILTPQGYPHRLSSHPDTSRAAMLIQWAAFQSTGGKRHSRILVSFCIAQVANAVIAASTVM